MMTTTTPVKWAVIECPKCNSKNIKYSVSKKIFKCKQCGKEFAISKN